ncbi:hypothetical protein KR222_008753 [Zaprionus bogoriensis]|nr:hypothetical protein KR222_008753 [Zaprionus bogoriensis]
MLTPVPKQWIYNYDKHGSDWKVELGNRQSPIPLVQNKTIISTAPKLNFINYNKKLSGPLKVINTGNTVAMRIPPAEDGTYAAICGCKLDSVYKAVQLHFHWGSADGLGSEHTINSRRYDGEVHIIHQNCAYKSKTEAVCNEDGFLVLALLLRMVSSPKVNLRALGHIIDKVNCLKDGKNSTFLDTPVTLRDILVLPGLDRRKFYTYKGSLTTPPCSEAVTWFVFPKPVDVSTHLLQRFWCLKDERGKTLKNTYRELQDVCDRKVYYRDGSTC